MARPLHIAITFPVSLGAPGGGSNDCFQLARHLALPEFFDPALHPRALSFANADGYARDPGREAA